MQRYAHSTGFLDLGTDAAATVVWSLTNPAATTGQPGRFVIGRRLHVEMNFAGVPAAARTAVALSRGTGTSAGGTQVLPAALARRFSLAADPVASVRYGAAGITGLTPDAFGDFMSTGLTQQLTSEVERDFIMPFDQPPTDPMDLDNSWVLSPETSLLLIVRGATSIAGIGLCVDVEWAERELAPLMA